MNVVKIISESLATNPGVFIAARTSKKTTDNLTKYCDANGLKYELPFHCTLVYDAKSRLPIKAVKIKPDYAKKVVLTPPYKFGKLGQDGKQNCLVLLFENRDIEDAHRRLVLANQLTHSYPKFLPHITLTYNGEHVDVNKLPLVDFDIEFIGEYKQRAV